VEERACGSRHTHLRLPVIALGIEDHDQHWPSRMQLLAGDLLLRRHHTLGPTQVDVHSAGLDAVDDPCRKLASMLRHLAQDLVALEVVDVAQHRVLGGLRGHALELFSGQHDDGLVAARITHAARHVQPAGRGVQLHRHHPWRTESPDISHGQRVFHGAQHLGQRNAQLCTQRVQRVCEAAGGPVRD